MRYASGVVADTRGIQSAVFAAEHHDVEKREQCLRHARAMKAVLLAAKAWARASATPERGRDGLSREYTTRGRLFAACARLEKIEKEVARG